MSPPEDPTKTLAKVVTASVLDSPTITGADNSVATCDNESNNGEFDAEFERRLLRKIDWWLVIFYSVVYIFRVIDSSNYANAAIINLENGTGIKQELGFSPSQWSWSQSIFSYSYMVFEPSNTIALKWFKPARWMFILIMSWGVSACCSAAVVNFPGMMCVRFAIGLAEAGFFPAVLYHMAFWYKPQELPQRVAFFYAVGQVSSALSGLLAYAISFMVSQNPATIRSCQNDNQLEISWLRLFIGWIRWPSGLEMAFSN
jgi:MFS family permease